MDGGATEEVRVLNLQELVIFLEAADTGSYSKAGRRLHISQPAISQNIHSLEKRFGAELFVRHGRRMQLSDAGQILVPIARELIAHSKRLEETMSSLEGEVVGEINIGCSTASGKYLLLGLIARFREAFPKVRINVLVGDRRRVTNWLRDGNVQLGISSRRIEFRDFDNQLFFTDEINLIVPAGHPWASFGEIHPDDLLDEPLILREEGSGSRDVLFEQLRQRDITPEMLNVAMILGNSEAIELAVAERIGVAFISHLSAARGLELGRVVKVQVQGLNLSRDILMVCNRSIPNTRAVTEFWNFATRQNWQAMIIPA